MREGVGDCDLTEEVDDENEEEEEEVEEEDEVELGGKEGELIGDCTAGGVKSSYSSTQRPSISGYDLPVSLWTALLQMMRLTFSGKALTGVWMSLAERASASALVGAVVSRSR